MTPGETITIISKDGAGNESQPATAVIPADVVLARQLLRRLKETKPMAIQSLELLIQMSRFNFTIAVNNYWQVAIQLLEAPSPFILQQG